MKVATSFYPPLGLFIIVFVVFRFALPLQQAQAMGSDYQETGGPGPSEKFSREELAQMLAPIALYPDVLLSQIEMASTYPVEVLEADRRLKNNPELEGEALDAVLLDKDWDPSVKAICHFPSILTMMSERITETTNLGNAFLAQEAEVMDVVQELRAKAHALGNLTTTSQQKVIVEKETIIIEPADPRIIYVPYYDPLSIYGPWRYPSHPPYSWSPAGVSIGISYWPGFYYGIAFGTWSYFDWRRHHIYINARKRPRYVRDDRWTARPGRWLHSPGHRRGVAYRDKPTARKYGQSPRRTPDFRRDTRGFPEHLDRDRYRGEDNHPRVDRDRKMRERAARDRQERERIERDRQMRNRVEKEKQEGRQVDRRKALQKKRPPDPALDNVFNRLEDGRRERRSSDRGRGSRQGRGRDDGKRKRR